MICSSCAPAVVATRKIRTSRIERTRTVFLSENGFLLTRRVISRAYRREDLLGCFPAARLGPQVRRAKDQLVEGTSENVGSFFAHRGSQETLPYDVLQKRVTPYL